MRALLAWMVLAVMLHAGSILKIYAASDLKYTLDEIIAHFIKKHPGIVIKPIYGASGKGMVMIERGAPFDLFFSANLDYVTVLAKKGLIAKEPKVHAKGALVLWSTHPHFDPALGLKNLTQPWVRKVAIANPKHAPYGMKAKEALENVRIYDKLKAKLVYGANIAQTAGFVKTGAADIGIVALSLVLAPTIQKSGHSAYYLLDETLYTPLLQGYGITKRGVEKPEALAFYRFIESDEARRIMKKYGFSVGEQR